MDLYIFARALFNKKLLSAGLEAQNPTLWQAQHPDSSAASDIIAKPTLQEEAVSELGETHPDFSGL